MPHATPDGSSVPSYETAIARLDAIVTELGAPDLSLDTALRLFEEGIGHLRIASAELARAEAQVQVLTEETANLFQLAPLATD